MPPTTNHHRPAITSRRNSTNINCPHPAPHPPRKKKGPHQQPAQKEHIMPFPCGLNVYITVEAVTLIGLVFLATTSLIANTAMAKRKKSGSGVKPTQPPQQQLKAANPTDAAGSAQEGTPTNPPPVIKEVDTRPETS